MQVGWWARLRERYEQVVAEYGRVAIGTYAVLAIVSFVGSWAAISAGWQYEGGVATAGTFGGAYVLYKAMQPLRIGATVLITPFAVRIWRRFGPAPSTS